MPRSAFYDKQWCMHFADDWMEEEGDLWTDMYDDKKADSPSNVAHHRCKFAIVEDAFNERWKAAVIFGRQITMDKSRTAGHYHSPITQGPDPKPICTGATYHTTCITDRSLAMYNLHARTFGGKMGDDLQSCHINTAMTQKWVNLISLLLNAIKGKPTTWETSWH